MRGRRARRSGMEKQLRRHQLTEILFGAHAEIAESRIARVRAVRLHARQPVHRLSGNDRAHRLAGRVGEIQVVSLPTEVAARRRHHVIGEHRGELRAHRTKGSRHGGIHVAGEEIRRVELVHDSRQAGERRREHAVVPIHRPKVVALQLVPGVQSRRIPPEGDALNFRLAYRLCDTKVLAHIVKEDLAAPRAADRIDERVDVPDGSIEIVGVVPWFVDQLDEQDRRLVFERGVRVGIDVPEQLPEVVGLRRDGGGTGAELFFPEVIRKALRGGVAQRVRPAGVVRLRGAQQHVHAPLAGPGNQVVQQVEMVVRDQVAGPVGVLPVAPQGETHAVPTHAGEVGHVVVNHLLAVGRHAACGAVIRGGRQDVVRAKERDLRAIVLPSHDALFVEIHRPRRRHRGYRALAREPRGAEKNADQSQSAGAHK